MSEDSFDEAERLIHNGQILHPVPGVGTVTGVPVIPQTQKRLPAEIADVEPNELARLMAEVISAASAEPEPVSPMEVVNRLLRLTTPRGHKVVWTRFDVHQVYALWSNKLERNRIGRGSNN